MSMISDPNDPSQRQSIRQYLQTEAIRERAAEQLAVLELELAEKERIIVTQAQENQNLREELERATKTINMLREMMRMESGGEENGLWNPVK